MKVGKIYEVYANGKSVRLIGSTSQSLKERRRNKYVKRFGLTVELRLVREIVRPVGYDDRDFDFYLKSCEAMDITRKKSYREDGGLNLISPLIQALGGKLLSSEMGKIGGQVNVQSGHMQNLCRTYNSDSEHQKMAYAAARKVLTHERLVAQGRKGGAKTVALGHLAKLRTPEHQSRAGKRSFELHGNPNHYRWHVRRNIVNTNCKLCIQSPSGIEVSELKK